VGGEVHRGDHHEDDQDELDLGLSKAPTLASRVEKHQAHGGEGVADGVQPRQAGLLSSRMQAT
jgi:hypothetical protein